MQLKFRVLPCSTDPGVVSVTITALAGLERISIIMIMVMMTLVRPFLVSLKKTPHIPFFKPFLIQDYLAK